MPAGDVGLYRSVTGGTSVTTSVATLTFTTTNAVAAYVPATIVLTSSVTVAASSARTDCARFQ